MNNEIERKFLVRTVPDISQYERMSYERYYLFNDNGIELRVQRKGTIFELERKVTITDLERTREKLQLTESEFMALKSTAGEAIIRDSYTISDRPAISIKIYRGKYEGLIRAEVEFQSVEELEQFQPLDWFGPEITHSPLARDSRLMQLSSQEFSSLISQEGHKR